MATTPIGAGTVSTPPLDGGASAVTPETTAKSTSTAKKTTKAFSADAMEALKTSGLAVFGVKGEKISGAEVGGSILSEFPIADLGQVKTKGRWAQGFRLDGGSLRLMWMNVRRTAEKDGTQGFEVFFQAQGPAIETYRQRLEQAGAKAGSYKFFNSDEDGTVEGKAALKKTGADWGPSSQQALSLEQAGKWAVDFVTSSPEALKGAFRIRVMGNDADATAALQEVIKKLGLQALFSPPAPNALERFKLLRFMWQVAPGAADPLRFRPLPDLGAALEPHLEKAELAADSLQAIAAEKLATPEMKERAQLASLLYQKSPKGFLDWVVSQYGDQHGMLIPSGASSPNQSLRTALSTAGIAEGSPALTAALEKDPNLEEAQSLMRLALLARKNRGTADAATARDIESVKLSELEGALAAVGIDPKGERVKNLRFQEVYPGYFTVLDPSLSVELEKAGARYLYSTSDNAERVWQMLSGGQKSSMTRFQEGVLIQGKSSDADFGTGGAFSVFSRLVTDSIIKKARREGTGTGGYSYSPTAFYDWGGSRPFKLILNRRILDRTDWYGYNGDNFGRSTGLTAENHGQRIINTINSNFSMSNEVMFPVGNDPSYVDFVVAPTEEKKKELVDFLTSKGMTEINGKKVEDFVIVHTKLFEHPDDITLTAAVEDAIFLAGFNTEIQAALTEAKTVAEQALPEKLAGEANQVMNKEAPAQLKSQAQYYATQIVDQACQDALNKKTDLISELGGDALKAAGLEAAKAAIGDSAKAQLSDANNYYYYYIDSAIQTAIQPKLSQTEIEKAVDEAVAAFVAAQPSPTADTPDIRYALEQALSAKLNDATKAAILAIAKVDGVEPAKAKIISMVDTEVPNNIRYNLQSTAKTAGAKGALATGPQELIGAILNEVKDAALSEGKLKLLESFKQNASSWLNWSVRPKIEELAKKLATEVIVADATPKALAATKDAAAEIAKKTEASFAEHHPDKVTPETQAKVPAAVEGAIKDLLSTASTSAAQSAASQETQKAYEKALEVLAASGLYDTLAAELMGTQAQTSTQNMLEQRVQNALSADIDGVINTALAEASAAVKDSMVEKLLEASLDRASAALIYNYQWNVINPRAKTGVDEVMKKLVVPAAPPPETAAAPATPETPTS
ncbi:MAG: hypothetical protein U1E65_34910 [Myxococcota bacterium]